MNKKTESTNTLVKAQRSSVTNPVTHPPMELLLQKALDEKVVRPSIEEYLPVMKILIMEKKFTNQKVRDWLSDHGAGNYGYATVAHILAKANKVWKAEQAEEAE